MTVKVQISGTLKEYSRETSEISISALNVGAALEALQSEYPSLYNCVCDETGRVRRHLNLFVNCDLVPIQNASGFDTLLHSGDVPAVWRSENGGSSWKKLVKGLPKKDSYFTILRDAMTTDACKAPAVYFGTTTGQLWMGRDGGEEWSCLFDSLPPIHCVKTAMV